MHLTLPTLAHTLDLGRLIGHLAPEMPAVSCLGLDGPLGAGKTHLTRGIALGAQINDPDLVSSPTYVLMNIYQGIKTVYHFDAYRLESPAAFLELGWDEILRGETGGGIVVVEWASRVADAMPQDTLWITLEHLAETQRSLALRAAGPTAQSLLAKITAARSAR